MSNLQLYFFYILVSLNLIMTFLTFKMVSILIDTMIKYINIVIEDHKERKEENA